MTRIDSLMSPDPIVATSNEPVAAVARRMAERGIGAVLIVDEGRLTGVFSERDLLTRVVAPGLDPAEANIGEVATRDVTAVTPDTHVKRCAEILREGGFRHLPVFEGNEAVGVVSARDLFEFAASGLEKFIEQARYQRQLLDGEDPYDHLGGSYAR